MDLNLERVVSWKVPDRFRRIVTIDTHTGGEPLRTIVSGFPELQGQTILERRRFVQQNLDALRKVLMWEPRGHADMYGCIVTPPERDDSDFGVLFLHNEGYSSMCGHGIIGVVTALIETGALSVDGNVVDLRIDAPAGLIQASAYVENGRVRRVSFENVPSWVVELDANVVLEDGTRVRYDLAFGGAFYAYVDGAQFDEPIRCLPGEHDRIVSLGRAIKHAVMKSRQIVHPESEDLGFLYGTIFVSPPVDSKNHSRNCCVFADGEVDRSPTGTGVSGRIALHVARGECTLNESISIESLVGSRFDVQAVREVDYFGQRAVIPLVTGDAFITGRHEFLSEPDDPMAEGFCLR
ncbi:MAG: proline racemase family protein [Pirellulaceae bacterium]